jgi:hypothetical protein
MSNTSFDNWDDDQLVEQLREAAVAQSDCRLDMERANQIDREQIVPYAAALHARGRETVRKILPLLHDANSNVRLIAASCVFDTDPAASRRVLQELIQDGGVMQLFAWAVWSRHDPQTAPDPVDFVRPGK